MEIDESVFLKYKSQAEVVLGKFNKELKDLFSSDPRFSGLSPMEQLDVLAIASIHLLATQMAAMAVRRPAIDKERMVAGTSAMLKELTDNYIKNWSVDKK